MTRGEWRSGWVPWGWGWRGAVLAVVAATVLLSLNATGVAGAQPPVAPSYVITRHLEGDVFTAPAGQRCAGPGQCASTSGGTAGDVRGAECSCQCLSNLPIFRDDLHVCVDDIHECSLVPFVSGPTSQTVPFVFLPLKGQIIFPSAEIQFPGNSSPVCVVSGARFLAKEGWLDMRNRSDSRADSEPPLRLLRDKGRNYLQWVGEAMLRRAMEGRLLLIQLMCKEEQNFFTPCVGLRVAGTPNSFSGVREVSFSAVNSNAGSSSGSGAQDTWGTGTLGAGGLVGASGALLAVAYVLAALVYMRNRRKKRRKRERQMAEAAAARMEEGAALGSALGSAMGSGPFGGRENAAYLTSDEGSSCCSDSAEETPASDSCNSDRAPHAHSVVSVMVHGRGAGGSDHYLLQDTAGIERLPEEDVSIVETLEAREDRPDTVRAMAGPARRKLYFNPAYFEPELLIAPPPAALEFLSKIREVITIAKHKMAAKRFAPSLVEIPEEESQSAPRSPRSTTVSAPAPAPALPPTPKMKQSPPLPPLSPPQSCSGCPGCTSAQLPPPGPPLGCNVCTDVPQWGPHSKQHHIRKWLEEVRVPRAGETDDAGSVKSEGSVYGPVTPLRGGPPNWGSFRQSDRPKDRDRDRPGEPRGEASRRRPVAPLPQPMPASSSSSSARTPAKCMRENMRAAREAAKAQAAATKALPGPKKDLPPKTPGRCKAAAPPVPAPASVTLVNGNPKQADEDSFRQRSGSISKPPTPAAATTAAFRARSSSVTNINRVGEEVGLRVKSNSISGNINNMDGINNVDDVRFNNNMEDRFSSFRSSARDIRTKDVDGDFDTTPLSRARSGSVSLQTNAGSRVRSGSVSGLNNMNDKRDSNVITNNERNARIHGSAEDTERTPTAPMPLPVPGLLTGLVAQQKEVLAKKLSSGSGGMPRKTPPCPPPPPPVNHVSAAPDKADKAAKPEVPKQLMDAVIKELVVQRGLETASPKSASPSPKSPSPSPSPSPAPAAPDPVAITVRSTQPSPALSAKREFRDVPSSPRSSVFEDSLERPRSAAAHRNGISTPSDYGEIPPNAVLTPRAVQNELNKVHNKINIQKLQTRPPPKKKPVPDDDNEYEIIVLNPAPVIDTSIDTTNIIKKKLEEEQKPKSAFALPDFLSGSEGYSLVSEVYVNDNYSFSSSPSPTNSSCSDGNERENLRERGRDRERGQAEKNIHYSEQQPGHLTIQVDDSPDNRRRLPEVDNFEPDTLDRKSITKLRVHRQAGARDSDIDHEDCHSEDYHSLHIDSYSYMDSLERPSSNLGGSQIFLRTSGSFRSDQHDRRCPAAEIVVAPGPGHGEPLSLNATPTPFSRMFGSLREIYESRARCRVLDGVGTQSLHGSLHGSVHGSQYSDTDCTSVASSRRSVRSQGAHGHGHGQTSSRRQRRQRCPSPPRARKPPARPPPPPLETTRAPPRPPPLRPPKPLTNGTSAKPQIPPQALYQEPPPGPPRPLADPWQRPAERDPSRPPLPPRNPKPALPPKSAPSSKAGSTTSCSSSKRRGHTPHSGNPAHRPLPPLPPLPPRYPLSTSTRSVGSNQDIDAMSAASADSLNSSDYEAFYSMPMSAASAPCVKGQFILQSASTASSPVARRARDSRLGGSLSQGDPHDSDLDAGSEKAASFSGATHLQETKLLLNGSGSRGRVGKDLVKHMRDKRSSDSVKKSWRRVVDRSTDRDKDRDRDRDRDRERERERERERPATTFPHKPEDSGYLSTDSNESKRRHRNSNGLADGSVHGVLPRVHSASPVVGKVQSQGNSHSQSQGSLSETDESLCDGASESGGESVATDSFFFGSFRGTALEARDKDRDRDRSDRESRHSHGSTTDRDRERRRSHGSGRRSSVVLVSQ